MSVLSNIGDEEAGDNIGVVILKIIKEAYTLRDTFLKEHNITMDDAKKDKPRYQKLWEEWLEENHYKKQGLTKILDSGIISK